MHHQAWYLPSLVYISELWAFIKSSLIIGFVYVISFLLGSYRVDCVFIVSLKRTLIRWSMFLYCCKSFKMWYSIIFDHYVHHRKVLWGGSWVWCLLFRALIVLLWVIWIIQKSVECELCSALSSVTNLCSNIPSSHLGREPIQVGIPSNEWNFNWHFDHLIIFLNYCLNVSLPQIFFSADWLNIRTVPEKQSTQFLVFSSVVN